MEKYTIKFLTDSGRLPIDIEAESFSVAVEQAISLGIDLRFADFSDTNLFAVDFSGHDLTGASFECSRLHMCHFEKCTLTNCNFSCAGLWECFAANSKWDYADLFETAFVATDISGCDWQLVKNIKYAVVGNFYDAVAPTNYDPVTPC